MNVEKDENKFYERLCNPQRIQRGGNGLNFASLAGVSQGSTGLVLLEVWLRRTIGQ